MRCAWARVIDFNVCAPLAAIQPSELTFVSSMWVCVARSRNRSSSSMVIGFLLVESCFDFNAQVDGLPPAGLVADDERLGRTVVAQPR